MRRRRSASTRRRTPGRRICSSASRFRSAWARHGRERSVEELVARARAAPPLRSLIDPNDATFTPPGDMPARIADYCGRSGQDVPEDEGAVVRCIFESLALKHAETVDLIAS